MHSWKPGKVETPKTNAELGTRNAETGVRPEAAAPFSKLSSLPHNREWSAPRKVSVSFRFLFPRSEFRVPRLLEFRVSCVALPVRSL
jgi:hypothetical protein